MVDHDFFSCREPCSKNQILTPGLVLHAARRSPEFSQSLL